jgi:hypothetical protein
VDGWLPSAQRVMHAKMTKPIRLVPGALVQAASLTPTMTERLALDVAH